jgi:hypothetical protein
MEGFASQLRRGANGRHFLGIFFGSQPLHQIRLRLQLKAALGALGQPICFPHRQDLGFVSHRRHTCVRSQHLYRPIPHGTLHNLNPGRRPHLLFSLLPVAKIREKDDLATKHERDSSRPGEAR